MCKFIFLIVEIIIFVVFEKVGELGLKFLIVVVFDVGGYVVVLKC